MILPDVSVLVHAHAADSALYDGLGCGRTLCLGYQRYWTGLGDNARFCAYRDQPQSGGASAAGSRCNGAASGLVGIAPCSYCASSDTHLARPRAELEGLKTAGNLTMDVHLAVLAMERGYIRLIRICAIYPFSQLEAMMADKEIEVFETTAGQVADVLKRLGVPKDRTITVMIESDSWLTRGPARLAPSRDRASATMISTG